MKKYLIGALALVLAVGFTAFTHPALYKKVVTKYMVYKGGGLDKTLVTSYDETTTPPAQCNFSVQICWFTINDDTPLTAITQSEFDSRVNALDATPQSSGFKLDNEADNHSTIEKRQ